MLSTTSKSGIDPGLNINLDWQSLSLASELSDPLQSSPLPPGSSSLPPPPEQLSLQWLKQFGTAGDDIAADITFDGSGNSYVTGSTRDSLFGSNVGEQDAWLAKFNSDGELLWGRQIGTSSYDSASQIALDSSGNIYIAGSTGGAFGGVSSGNRDVWLAKYNSDGAGLWIQQTDFNGSDSISDLEVDGLGNVLASGGSYIGRMVGSRNVSWAARYSSNGQLAWQQHYSIGFYGETKNIMPQGLALDNANNLYVALNVGPWKRYGQVSRDDPHPYWDNGVFHSGIQQDGTGSLISKYNSSGSLMWQKYLDFALDSGGYDSIAADDLGNFYLGSKSDLSKYDSNGSLLWEQDLTTSQTLADITVDGQGNAYLSGWSANNDAWAAKYNHDGTFAWEEEFGTPESDRIYAIAVDSTGKVYLAGSTQGTLGQANAGGEDPWLAQYLQVPDDLNHAPDSLRFSLDRIQYKATETLTLKNGWVQDLDGASDLARIHLQLILPNDVAINIANITDFTPASWSPDWATFNYNLNLNGASVGTYRLKAIAYDTSGAASSAFERQFLVYSNTAPERLQFSLESNQYEANETLNLKNAWVYDKDGSNDLASIDFELIDEMGNAIDLGDATQFIPATWSHQWANFDYSLNLAQLGLDLGIYTLRGTAYDLSGAQGSSFERKFQLNLPTTAALEWLKDVDNGGGDIAIDNAGNVYISGGIVKWITQGGYNTSHTDIWLAKYDSDGNLLWQDDWGSTSSDRTSGITVDGAGNVYLTGMTTGSLSGTNSGGSDAWLAKYDNNGNLSWIEQLGTTSHDFAVDVAVDETGNLYITGNTEGDLGGTKVGSRDPWIAKYDNDGSLLWVEQWGRSGFNIPAGTAVDNVGNVYITGYANGDAWLAKYDGSGNQLWTRDLGTASAEDSAGIAADRFGNIYLTGFTYGSLGGTNQGQSDVWLAKYNGNGDLIWTQQFGSDSYENPDGIAVDDLGNIYLTGNTQGDLAGTNAGLTDVWVAKYDSSGNLSWQQQWGTDDYEFLFGVAVDGDRDVYIFGQTGNATADHWLAKYS